MDMEEIKQLVQLMVDNDLGELDITDGDKKISLKRGAGGMVSLAPAAAASPVPVAPVGPAALAAPVVHAENLLEIKSPMVGTFYAAPSPDSDPYVAVGATISDESVVCIIEAMKVMNEIKAECDGTIAEICVKNAQPVEYGQVLFRVRPN
jgi:acetyl-CoA carboxylase biotin carboxyl carrier protein